MENGDLEFRWQKSFYDHIIRDGGSLKTIREYIRNNPIGWQPDADHDDNLCKFERALIITPSLLGFLKKYGIINAVRGGNNISIQLFKFNILVWQKKSR